MSGMPATGGSSVFPASKKALGLLEIWFLFGNLVPRPLDGKALFHNVKEGFYL